MENKRSFKQHKVPLYILATIISLICIILSLTVETDNESYMYAGTTFLMFFLNLEFKFITERSNSFLICYTVVTVTACIISYFTFKYYYIDSPRGLYMYGFVLAALIYTVISIYDKILGIKPADYLSDDQ